MDLLVLWCNYMQVLPHMSVQTFFNCFYLFCVIFPLASLQYITVTRTRSHGCVQVHTVKANATPFGWSGLQHDPGFTDILHSHFDLGKAMYNSPSPPLPSPPFPWSLLNFKASEGWCLYSEGGLYQT